MVNGISRVNSPSNCQRAAQVSSALVCVAGLAVMILGIYDKLPRAAMWGGGAAALGSLIAFVCVSCSKTQMHFYHGNCDDVKDVGWGCAWRCIQTILKSFDSEISLRDLYKIYHQEGIPTDGSKGEWAEPGIGKQALEHFGLGSPKIVLYNGHTGSKLTPTSDEQISGFEALKARLFAHFTHHNTPVMADNSCYAMLICGIRESGDHVVLEIADPHKNNASDSRYDVILDKKTGKQIRNTAIDKDDESNGLRTGRIPSFEKPWMFLFPELAKS